MVDSRTRQAIAYMMDFAQRTGLASDRPARRYLWTDAFAVCNFLGLACRTGDKHYQELAIRLIDQVHHTLGRQRPDHTKSGWISGLRDSEGEAHPTRGGLRIGKKYPEREPHEPLDDRLEWDRDGQYFHYLTQWMHALDQATRVTGQSVFNLWARELAETACSAFTYFSPGVGKSRKMYWKMSIDLSRPQVSTMGQHDPLDGYITCLQLQATKGRLGDSASGPDLREPIREFKAMIEGGVRATADPLGIGGLLIDAYRLQRLMQSGKAVNDGLLDSLLLAAQTGLDDFTAGNELHERADWRLPFRELGLAIGLYAARSMWEAVRGESSPAPEGTSVVSRLESLMAYAPLTERIESFWQKPEHRAARTWLEHRDINEVMLATSLAPEGFLDLAITDRRQA